MCKVQLSPAIGRARGFSKDRDPCRVSSQARDILVDPLQSEVLVFEAKIREASSVEGRAVEEAESA